MREILFRGKYEENGEKTWVYGTPQTNPRGQTFICADMMHGWVVDPDTVSQFTGLTDKNGKKVFEGDIIRVVYETDCVPGNVPETWAELYTVVFDNEHHAWFTKLEDGELGEWLCEYDGDCEIIGNIHDKELLGKEG